jgi:hypothetical protein
MHANVPSNFCRNVLWAPLLASPSHDQTDERPVSSIWSLSPSLCPSPSLSLPARVCMWGGRGVRVCKYDSLMCYCRCEDNQNFIIIRSIIYYIFFVECAFMRAQAVRALRFCAGDLEKAVDIAFEHRKAVKVG